MKRTAIASALVIAAGIVSAQPSTVLIEACNGIQDAAKRLECLKAASSQPSPSTVSVSQRLRDTIAGVEGAINAGVSFNQYQMLLLDLSREVGVFKTSQPPAEAASLLDEAMEAYADAGRFWAASIRYSSRNRNMFVLGNVLPDVELQIAGLAYLPARYSLPITRGDALGMSSGVERLVGLQTMWRFAKEHSDKAFEMLAQPSKAPAAPPPGNVS